MGLIGDLIGKGFDWAKTVATNAKVGKEAIASGFTSGLVPQQSKQTAAANAVGPFGLSPMQLLAAIGTILSFFFILWSLFNRKR